MLIAWLYFQIADFGLSNLYQRDEYLQTFCGSPLYASPEIVNGRPYKGPEVDSWSLGVLLYTLVHEAMPFDGHDYKTLVRQISTGDYRKPTKPSGIYSLSVLLNRTPILGKLLSDNLCNVHILYFLMGYLPWKSHHLGFEPIPKQNSVKRQKAIGQIGGN